MRIYQDAFVNFGKIFLFSILFFPHNTGKTCELSHEADVSNILRGHLDRKI